MGRGIEIRGTNALVKSLRKKAELEDVKTIVKINTTELYRKMASDAPVDTGFLRRSIIFSLANAGMTGRIVVQAECAPYLIFGTRFMAKRDFLRPNLNKQKQKFKSDMDRLVK